MVLVLLLTLLGELLERHLFFTAVGRAQDAGRARVMSASTTSTRLGRLAQRLGALIRQRDGQLDARAAAGARASSGWARCRRTHCPDATTTMVCGFCSTGCGLNIHLKEGAGGQPDAGHRLPGQPRHGLPQGLGGPHAARRRRPRHHAAAARTPGTARSRSTGRPRCETFRDRFKAIQASTGRDSVAFLSTGQIATEEMALLGALAKFGMGMRARRRQHPAVHGHGRRRLQAVVRLRRPAVHLRGLRGVGRHRPRRRQPLHRASDPVGARAAQSAPSRDHRRRSAQDRNGDGGHAAPARSSRSPTWSSSTASPAS